MHSTTHDRTTPTNQSPATTHPTSLHMYGTYAILHYQSVAINPPLLSYQQLLRRSAM